MKNAILSSILTAGLGISAWAAGTPMEIAEDASLVIDDFADENLNGWAFITDNGDLGKSTLETSLVDVVINLAPGTDGVAAKALHFDFTLDKGAYQYNPYVEMFVQLADDGSSLDLSSCSEIQYEYRGGVGVGPYNHAFRVVGDTNVANVGYNYHSTTLSGYSVDMGWKTASIKWNVLRQANGWGTIQDIDLVRKNVTGFSWQFTRNPQYSGEKHSGSFEIANIRCVNVPSYTVEFYHGEKLLKSKVYTKGEMPSADELGTFYEGMYEYTVKGWNPSLTVVTGNAAYQVVADSSLLKSRVVFYDYSDYGYGRALQTQDVEYGSIPVYVGIEPVRLPTEEYSYTFKGWGVLNCEVQTEEYCDDKWGCETYERTVCTTDYVETLPPVTYDVGYVPVFDSTVNEYTVKFVSYDGTILSEKKYPYGTESESIERPEAPSRNGDGGVVYTFEGWTPYVSDVVGNAVYMVSYLATTTGEDPVELYTVTFMNDGEILQTGEYEYGDYPVYKGPTPTKEPTVAFEYTFYDWQDFYGNYVDDVYGNVVYTPVWNTNSRKYWVVFKDDDGSVIDSVRLEYGAELYDWYLYSWYGIKTKSSEDGYQLVGWTPELQTVKGRAVYQATYNYRAQFVSEGNVITSDFYAPGDVPSYNVTWYGEPTKSPTVEYSYNFVGWDKEFEPMTAPVTFNAVFVPVSVPKAPVIEIATGESWLVDDFDDDNDVSKLGTQWFTYNDNETVKRVDADGNEIYYASEISATPVISGGSLKVTYKRDFEIYDGYQYSVGWLGVGVPLAVNDEPVDLSQCNAVQYDYKGGAHYFGVSTVFDTDGSAISKYFGSSKNWTTATVYRNELEKEWGNAVNASVAFSHATAFVWGDMEGEGTLELDNIRCLNKPSYIVRFYNGETLVDSAAFAEGEKIVYRGAIDEFNFTDGMGDEQYDYVFGGWDPELTEETVATGNVDYHAVINTSIITYTVYYYDKYDNYIGSVDVEYGKVPEYDGIPTMNADDECSQWTFTGWRYYDAYWNVLEKIEPVPGVARAQAVFTCAAPTLYTVSFVNEVGEPIVDKDGEPITKQYPYGTDDDEIEFPEAPEKAPSAECTYEPYWQNESGWGSVYEDATYRLTYWCNTREYKVKFVYGDYTDEYSYSYGTSFGSMWMLRDEPELYPYGSVHYEFDKWEPVVDEKAILTGDITFTAKYNESYAVRFEEYWGSLMPVNGEDYNYYAAGTPLSEILTPEVVPVREPECDWENPDDCTEFEFVGWTPAITDDAVLTEPVTFRPMYKSSKNTYTVAFMIGSDVVSSIDVAAGEIPEYEGWNLSWDDNQYIYHWNPEDGWEEPFAPVTGPMVYHAKFTTELKKYEITFINDDGTVLKEAAEYEYGTTVTDAPTETQILAGKTGMFNGWCEAYYDDDDEKWYRSNCSSDDLIIDGDATTYMADIKYQITFQNYDGNVVQIYDSYYGEDLRGYRLLSLQIFHGRYFTKPSTDEYDYTWKGLEDVMKGWDKEVVSVTKSEVYTAVFDSVKRQYEIAFVDDDGESELMPAKSYDYGTEASEIELPADPTKEPTTKLSYTFAGWVLDGEVGVQNVCGNATYVASYTSAPRLYTITFVDDEGTVIATKKYAYETAASSIELPTAPTRDGFKFVGWTPEIANVTSAATYEAVYVENSKYVITWVNDDGTELKRDIYDEGATPKYSGDVPTKESDAENDYAFSGWTPAITAVNGDAEYKATYNATVRSYVVTFVNYDNTELSSKSYLYGTPAEQITVPTVPERPATDRYVYTFAGWTPSVDMVTGNVTYKALFGSAPRTFTVSFKLENGTEVYVGQYQYGTEVNLDYMYQPENRETDECYYTFDKWVSSTGSNIVTGDMEYTAVYHECVVKKYFVSFYNPVTKAYVGNEPYDYGTKASNIVIPEMPETIEVGRCTYTFDGWNKDLADVTETVQYDAVYKEECAVVSSSSAESPVSSSSEVPPVSSSSEPPVVSSSSEEPVVSSSSEPPVVSSSSEVPPASSSSEPPVVSSSSEVPVVSSSSEPPVVSSSSEVPPASSSSEPPVVSSSSEVIVVSSSSEPPVVSSSSEVPPASSTSEPPVVSSSSEEPVVSSSSEPPVVSSSSEVPPASSSSKPPVVSSSSAVPPASSSSVEPPKSSSSSVTPESSSSENSAYAANSLLSTVKFGFTNRTLTIMLTHPSAIRVQVFDMNGLLLEGFNEFVVNSKDFDLSALKQGNYVVRVTGDNVKKSTRISIR